MAVKNDTDNFYETENTYIPIDDWSIYNKAFEVIKSEAVEYHFIKVPLLGQCNDGGNKKKKAKTFWCGRTSASMVYNYRILATQSSPESYYIKHGWGSGSPVMDLLHPDESKAFLSGGLCATRALAGYDKDIKVNYMEKESLFSGTSFSHAQAPAIASSPGKINKFYSLILSSLMANNPVVLYTYFSKTSKASGHIILLCGFAYFSEHLWFLVADPATLNGKRDSMGLTFYNDNWITTGLGSINGFNHVIIDYGKWYKAKASLYLLKASWLLKPHPMFKPGILLDYQGKKNGSRFLYSTEHFRCPGELLITNLKSKFSYPIASSFDQGRPIDYFHRSESFEGGFYPAGASQTLHGGIHLEVCGTGKTPIYSLAPGYIVAVRLVEKTTGFYQYLLDKGFLDEADDEKKAALKEFENDYACFILLKHKMFDAAEAEFSFYSLYMHLAPAEDIPGSLFDYKESYDDIKWFAKMKNHRGKLTFNLADGNRQYFISPPAADYIRSGDTLGEHMKNAYNALMMGKIASFSAPFLHVDGGEIIGYANCKRGGVIHWEVFSPAGSGSGIRKLLEADIELGQPFHNGGLLQPYLEDYYKEDNFLEPPEIERLLDYITDECVDKYVLEDEISRMELLSSAEDQLETYWEAITGYFMSCGSFYKSPGTAYVHPSAGPYGYTVNIKADSTTVNIAIPVDTGLKIIALNENGSAVLDFTGCFNLQNLIDGIELYLPVQVYRIQIQAAECVFLELKTNPEALFKKFLEYRLRNVFLEHLNEWTPIGIKKLLKKMQDKSIIPGSGDIDFDTLDDDVLPYCWWKNMGSDINEEHFLPLDCETSIFGTQLPYDAKVHNINPVTTMWLLKLLHEDKKLTLNTRYKVEGVNDPLYIAWTTDNNQMIISYGSIVNVFVIGKNYKQETGLKLIVKKSFGGDEELIDVEYDETGFFTASLPVLFWGYDCTLFIERSGVLLSGVASNGLTFDIQPPAILESGLSRDSECKEGEYYLNLNFKKDGGCDSSDNAWSFVPGELEGLLYLYYKKTELAPPFSFIPQVEGISHYPCSFFGTENLNKKGNEIKIKLDLSSAIDKAKKSAPLYSYNKIELKYKIVIIQGGLKSYLDEPGEHNGESPYLKYEDILPGSRIIYPFDEDKFLSFNYSEEDLL